MARRFELSEGTSNKFWEVDVAGARMTVRFGRIGTDGQTKVKSFASAALAKEAAARLVAEKMGKGYAEASTTTKTKTKTKTKPSTKGTSVPAKISKPRPITKVMGSPHWTSGPIVVAPAAVHDKWMKTFGKAEAGAVSKLKKAVNIAQLEGAMAVVVRHSQDSGTCTMAYPFDGGVVLVSAEGRDAGSPKVLGSAPIGEIDGYKKVGDVKLTKDEVLFDAWSKDPRVMPDRRKRVPLPLPAGSYVVELAQGIERTIQLFPNQTTTVKYRFVRLRKHGVEAPAAIAPAKKVAEAIAGPLVASEEVKRAAKSLVTVGGTDDGGPVLVPAAIVKTWNGMGDDEHEGHSDMVFEMDGVGVAKHAGVDILGVPSDTGTMFYPTEKGGLLIGWYGAESAAGCLAAALSIPEKLWQKTKHRFPVRGGDLVMFGHRLEARELNTKNSLRVQLAPGIYRVDACWDYEAQVRVAKVESTSIMAIRLERA